MDQDMVVLCAKLEPRAKFVASHDLRNIKALLLREAMQLIGWPERDIGENAVGSPFRHVLPKQSPA